SDAQPATTAQESPVTPAPRREVSLEGRVGFPTGYIRVSETVTHGTRLRLSDLGLDVSEAVEAGVAFWLTPRDAVRATYLYYVLRGSTTLDRAILYGGLLPKVDSLRTEGGTVYTWQSHADAGLAVTYALTPRLGVEAGYQYTYFHQHEKSHEDNNVFELIDHGLRARLTLRF